MACGFDFFPPNLFQSGLLEPWKAFWIAFGYNKLEVSSIHTF